MLLIMGMFVLKCLLLEHEVVGEMMQHVIVHTWSWCRHSHHVRGWEHSLLLHSADLLLLWWNTVRINTLELTHSVCVERSDWRQDIFSETETLVKTEVSGHETSRDISDLVETRRDW